MRYYWVHFQVTKPTGTFFIGSCEWQRELPICRVTDINDIAVAIGHKLMQEGKASVGDNIEIVRWQAFEEPSILLPDRLAGQRLPN